MSKKLIEITRGNIVECCHYGDIAVVNTKGEVLYSVGEAEKFTYMRSSAKPLQGLNVILSGAAEHYNLTNKELAVICSSHYAEPYHLETIQSILSKIGLNHKHILGGTVTSLSAKYALQLAWERVELNSLYSDCSGKHSGMLAVCRHSNYPIENYLSPEHQCQQEILRDIAYICELEEDDIQIGIDGCSAPVHAMPLYNMALGYARFANPADLDPSYQEACNRIFDAMNEFPEMISGTNGFCTELIKLTNGKLIGKVGAEGVYCVGLRNCGIGFAVKIESGSMAVLPPVVIQILKDLAVLTAAELSALSKYEVMPNTNDLNTVVGKIGAAFKLK